MAWRRGEQRPVLQADRSFRPRGLSCRVNASGSRQSDRAEPCEYDCDPGVILLHRQGVSAPPGDRVVCADRRRATPLCAAPILQPIETLAGNKTFERQQPAPVIRRLDAFSAFSRHLAQGNGEQFCPFAPAKRPLPIERDGERKGLGVPRLEKYRPGFRAGQVGRLRRAGLVHVARSPAGSR